MDKTMEFMKKNVVVLDNASDIMETILKDMDELLENGDNNTVDRKRLMVLVESMLNVNYSITNILGNNMVYIVENDTDYHDSKKKVGINKEIESKFKKYEKWLLNADLSNLKSKEDNQSKPSVVNIPPEVCFKLGELIGTMSRLSISLENMDAKDGIALKTMITMELAILEKKAMNIAQELFSSKK